MKKKNQRLALGGMIAALYVVLTLIFRALNVLGIEIRISEILCVLPIFFPIAVPSLFVGCFVANLFSGTVIDMLLGSFATLIGAIGTRRFRKNKFLSRFSPVIANTVIIPLVMKWGYGFEKGYFAAAFLVFCSETLSAVFLGEILRRRLEKIFNGKKR